MKNSTFGWKKRKTNIIVLLYGGPNTQNKENIAIKKKPQFKANVAIKENGKSGKHYVLMVVGKHSLKLLFPIKTKYNYSSMYSKFINQLFSPSGWSRMEYGDLNKVSFLLNDVLKFPSNSLNTMFLYCIYYLHLFSLSSP